MTRKEVLGEKLDLYGRQDYKLKVRTNENNVSGLKNRKL